MCQQGSSSVFLTEVVELFQCTIPVLYDYNVKNLYLDSDVYFLGEVISLDIVMDM